MNTLHVTLLCLPLLISGCAQAGAKVDNPDARAGMEGKWQIESTPGLRAYTWYDGEQKRTVWLDPMLIAEFNPPPVSQSQIKAVFPAAQAINTAQPFVRLWRLDEMLTDASTVRTLSDKGRFSPVFYDVKAASQTKRALPGGAMVRFQPNWSENQIEQWVRDQRLEIERKLDFADNTYLVKTGPGLEAIETANRLYETGEVIAAAPDWWVEVAHR